MINLMPYDDKQNLVYANRNHHIKNWILALLGCSIISAGIILVGYIHLSKTTQRYSEALTTEREQLNQQNPESIKKETETISNNLKLAVQVLSKEILFSRLIERIGQSLPSGTIVTDLSLTQTVTGGIDLTFGATNEQSGTQIQLNLSDPENKIFKTADLNNIQCAPVTASTSLIDQQYPCKVSIRALFSDNNDFGFISSNSPNQGAKNQ